MSLEFKKSVCLNIIEKYESANKREPVIQKTMGNNEILLEKVMDMNDNLEPLPGNSPYENFGEWIGEIERSIESSLKSLERIEDQKAAIVALQYYIDNAA